MERPIFKTILLKGEAGNNISTIEKTATNGLTDTYTVTLTDGSTSTFDVTNGNGIVSIEKTSTTNLVDTYTITLANGDTATFDVTNGIVVDSALSNSSTNAVQNKVVTAELNNFMNDTTAMNIRISNNTSKITSLYLSMCPSANIQEDEVATKRYITGSYMIYNNKLYKVTATIQSGGTIEEGTNVEETTVADEFANRAQIYKTFSLQTYTGSLSQWQSTVLEFDFSTIDSTLGSGWSIGGVDVNTDCDFILSGVKLVDDTTVRVSITNAYSSAQSNIQVTANVWFYHSKTSN